ncbi:MAG TPA: DUF4349 domain-containing protein [Solirubrobacteraceae bacterium]|jgi:hypothetical protein
MNDTEQQLRDDLRATAPQPRPEFAARLERRVEAGFKPAKPARAPRRRINLWAPSIALACTALIAVVIAVAGSTTSSDDLVGGSSGGGDSALLSTGDDDSASSGGSAEAPPAPPAAAEDQADRPRALALTPDSNSGRGRGDDRVVERRTALDLETNADDFSEATDDVLRVADDNDVIVQRSNVSQEGGKGFARYDLRVPASRLDDTLAALSRIAHVTSRTASSEDITRAYVSATDRLDDARSERRALLKALEKADTDVEAEAIRGQIRLARARIALAQRDVDALQRRADRARVTVTVRSTGKKSEGGAWTPGDALHDSVRILEVAAGVAVVTAAALSPFALLAFFTVLGGRTVRRRRREAALG